MATSSTPPSAILHIRMCSALMVEPSQRITVYLFIRAVFPTLRSFLTDRHDDHPARTGQVPRNIRIGDSIPPKEDWPSGDPPMTCPELGLTNTRGRYRTRISESPTP